MSTTLTHSLTARHGVTLCCGQLGIVMEFMSDGSLWDQLHGVLGDDDVELSLQHKLTIGEQISSALKFVHEAGSAHRDIKPHNVLLRGMSTVSPFSVCAKLCDLGFVKHRNQALSTTGSAGGGGVFVGTPAYAAPEVFAKAVVDTDIASWMACDVYSFAVVLWEMHVGLEPFFGDSPAAIEAAVTSGRRPADTPGCAMTDPTPAAVRDAVTRAWAQRPRERCTAAELCALLAGVV